MTRAPHETPPVVLSAASEISRSDLISRTRASGCAALLLLCAAGTAHAFHTPATFDDSAASGGGNRMYFTGSTRQNGYDCTLCHTDGAHAITAKVDAMPPLAGTYTPGTTYVITVTLVGEHRGFGAASNQNSFAAEVVDDGGRTAGTLAASDDIALVDDGRVAGGISTGRGETRWTFPWQAPAAGTGALTLAVALVDGDGASSTTELTDPGGDDVAVAKLRLCETTAGCAAPPREPQTTSRAAGCNAGGEASLLVVLVGLLVLRRRALPLVVLAGCFDPTVPGECPDHVCNGQAGPDGGTAGCRESWMCSSWEAPPGSDLATRTCTDNNNIGTTVCKPSEGPVQLPSLDLDYFKCNVQPILQRDCAMMGCHGTDTGRPFRDYARGRWRNNEIVNRTGTCIPQTGTVNLQTAGSGTVMCEGWLPHTQAEWKKDFDSARSFMLDAATPEDSLMLKMPTVGGLPHIDIKLFDSSAPAYATLRSWLGGARLGTTCNTGKN